MLSFQSIDCGRQFSDWYSNTPRVSTIRNHTPRFINLRWGTDLDPSKAVVEFFNYSSILPHQQARTFTNTWFFWHLSRQYSGYGCASISNYRHTAVCTALSHTPGS